jgi:hypothetical protein
MKKTTILLISILALKLYGQTFNTDPCFTKIFEDNFNSLNTTNWSVQNRISWTDALTWNLPSNITFPSGTGVLRIKLDRQTHNGRPYCGGELTSNATYTSGIYVETRAKNPTGTNGFSNSVWLWGGLHDNGTCNCSCGFCHPTDPTQNINRCGCQNYNENDFLEYFGSSPNHSSRNRIWCTQNGQCVIGLENNFHFGQDIPTNWHTYGTFWNNGRTSFHYDDKLTFTGNTVSTSPMMIDIDLWAHQWSVNANTPMPKYFDVDYIRVFRINRSNNQCGIVINNPANMTGYTYNLKKSIKLQTTAISRNIRHSFWATDFIELGHGSNFEIPTSNQEITFGIGECWQ